MGIFAQTMALLGGAVVAKVSDSWSGPLFGGHREMEHDGCAVFSQIGVCWWP